jgi:hypothetical protein
MLSKLPVTAAAPHVSSAAAAACLLCAVSRQVVARVSRSQRLAVVAQAAPAKYDYDLVIIGCGVGGHGAALHAVEQVGMPCTHTARPRGWSSQGLTWHRSSPQDQAQLCTRTGVHAAPSTPGPHSAQQGAVLLVVQQSRAASGSSNRSLPCMCPTGPTSIVAVLVLLLRQQSLNVNVTHSSRRQSKPGEPRDRFAAITVEPALLQHSKPSPAGRIALEALSAVQQQYTAWITAAVQQ